MLHLNGYKINNPTLLARIPHKELEDLFVGYGYKPYFVEGDDLESMHQAMAATLEQCVKEIKGYQKKARDSGKAFRPQWPMVILRSPKGWSAPRKLQDHYLEGFWRSHQVPITKPRDDPEQLKILEDWMRSYGPDRLFDKSGAPVSTLTELCPKGSQRMSANPVANGGILKKPLKLPDFRDYAVKVDNAAGVMSGGMANMATWLRDVIKNNPNNFRLFG